MGGIFINYRGEDSQTAAALIDRELAARFGGDQVFLDSRSIPAGSDFVEELLGRLRVCSVLLVVIGPRWLSLTDEVGRRRVDDPRDWIRREIVEAFAYGLRVVPVLADGARLPAEAELPGDIAGLSRRQYVPLRRRYTAVDLAYLVERVTEADPGLARAAAVDQESHVHNKFDSTVVGSVVQANTVQSGIHVHPGRPDVVPRQIPAAVAHFAGRSGELAALTGLVRGRVATGGTVVISAVSGTAGVGKTALAVYWAHQVSDRFPDGQLYVDLRGFDPGGQVMAPAEAVRRFLDALGVPAERIPVDLHAQAALYRSLLAGKRMLVVLDNARDTAQVRPLLPGAPTCLVVVTSRNQLTGLIAANGAYPITVDLLTDDEARQLLARRLGADRVAAKPDAVAEIITRCARLPLALALVAARAAIRPHAGLHLLAEELRDTQQRWQALAGDDPTSDVRAVLSWSYQALTPAAARLFRLLGLHPGPDLGAPAAASLAGVATNTVRPILAELTRASLLIEHVPGRYAFHDLLHAYATDLTHTTDPDQHRHAATHRILDHYLHTAHTADRLLDPIRDPITLTAPEPGATSQHLTDHQQALDWFTTEHPVLLAAIGRAAATSFDTHIWQLAWTLGTFLDRRGQWHDLTAAGRAAVAATHRLADSLAEARAHRTLARAYIRLGRLDDAHIQLSHALDLAIKSNDQTGQAHTHYGLGYLWERRGGYPQALDHARQALDLFQAADHQIGSARALNQIGWCHALFGEHQRALTACQQALTLHRDLDDRPGQAATWDSLGYAHHHLGQHAQAITCYQHALTLFRDLGDRYAEATILTHLGDTHQVTGNPRSAREAWQQALTILDDLHHPDADKIRTKLATPPPDPVARDAHHDGQPARRP